MSKFAPGDIVEIGSSYFPYSPPIGTRGIVLDPTSGEVARYFDHSEIPDDCLAAKFSGFDSVLGGFIILPEAAVRAVSPLRLLAEQSD